MAPYTLIEAGDSSLSYKCRKKALTRWHKSKDPDSCPCTNSGTPLSWRKKDAQDGPGIWLPRSRWPFRTDLATYGSFLHSIVLSCGLDLAGLLPAPALHSATEESEVTWQESIKKLTWPGAWENTSIFRGELWRWMCSSNTSKYSILRYLMNREAHLKMAYQLRDKQ